MLEGLALEHRYVWTVLVYMYMCSLLDSNVHSADRLQYTMYMYMYVYHTCGVTLIWIKQATCKLVLCACVGACLQVYMQSA